MKQYTKKPFVRLDYSILAIKEITSTDKIVLAYNWGDWGKGGYFATNKYAAGVLSMNIKTFKKSALKLKKLGLWKVRGTFVEANAAPTPVGKESAILPPKTDVLWEDNYFFALPEPEPITPAEVAECTVLARIVPLDADGNLMTYDQLENANWSAGMLREPEPFTDEQLNAAKRLEYIQSRARLFYEKSHK
jgi:hypothetical protein